MLHFAKWKTALILLVSVMGILFAAPNAVSPNVLQGLPDWVPHKQLHLGLDLQGGAHMLLEIDTDTIIKERLETIIDDVRVNLRQDRIGYQNLVSQVAKNSVSVRIRKAEQLDEARSKLRTLAAPVTTSLLTGVSGAQDIAITDGPGNTLVLTLTDAAITERIRSAVEQSIEIVRRRIDELGTTEPTIQRQGTDRILVQVPGLNDPQRLKELLGRTAKLVFRMVDVTTSAQQAQATRPPSGSEILSSADGTNTPYLVQKRILVSGENLVDAQPGFDQRPMNRSCRSGSTPPERKGSAV